MAPTTTTIVASTVAAIATGVLAYAVYFDHRRRTDPEFRREIRRSYRRQARLDKERAEQNVNAQRYAIRRFVDEAKEEGFPTAVEAKEAYFLEQVSNGELLGADHHRTTNSVVHTTATKAVEAALSFYRALKVYPTPGDLIGIYDKTVAKPILDILAEMIAYDGTLKIGASGASYGGPSNDDVAEMMREMGISGPGLD
ncbi:mitochondrial outer membrane translocase complex, subunit Tom20 domain-containing protein [Apodospora peruviana]|uniref:Mitochondrial outer membrane translocase complex, subunit Tom20 domain-containing protein n=1 Tax=Apodospora peruviana TaxID=516989 RepID=A0AAE0I5B3_9PEZI|nr:mitochondrial outer membrane translocase complex, subunit Tom20 domain-containing protein [Apodospora peruviana]